VGATAGPPGRLDQAILPPKAMSNRDAKASSFLSTVHNTVPGVSRAEASSAISTAPQPES